VGPSVRRQTSLPRPACPGDPSGERRKFKRWSRDGEYGNSDGEYGNSDGEYGNSDGEYGNSDGEYGNSDGEYGKFKLRFRWVRSADILSNGDRVPTRGGDVFDRGDASQPRGAAAARAGCGLPGIPRARLEAAAARRRIALR
jgi:hypothetical protein